MKKFCRFLSLFVIMFLLLAVGCSNDENFNFDFGESSYYVNCGEEINLFDSKLKTNLPNYEITSVYIENPSIAEYSSGKVTGLAVGETKIKVTVEYDEIYYQASFNLIVKSNEENKNELSVSCEVLQISSELNVVTISVFKDENSYYDYSVVVKEQASSHVFSKRKVLSFYEIEYKPGSIFDVIITDNLNALNVIEINSLNF